MTPDIEKLRQKYMDNPPEGMTSKDIRNMSEDSVPMFCSNAYLLTLQSKPHQTDFTLSNEAYTTTTYQ